MKKCYLSFIMIGLVFVMVSMVNVKPAQAARPATPTNLEAVGGNYSFINLSWTDNSDNESLFRIWRKKQGDAYFHDCFTVPANTRKYKDEGLEAGTTYCYRMAASNDDGNSAYSNEVSAATAERPTIRILSPNGGEVWRAGEKHYITWTTDADLVTGIRYSSEYEPGHFTYKDIAHNLLPDVHTCLWTVPELNSTQVKIRVYGHPVDSGETFQDETDAYFTITPSETTDVVPFSLPAPSNLVVENEGTKVGLTWQDNSSSELGFRIYYRINDGESSILDSVGPNTSSYGTTLAPGNSYSFRVQAFNAMVTSAYSNAASVTISNSGGGVEPEDDSDSSPGTGQTVLRFYIDSTEYYVKRPSESNSQLKTMDTAPIISGGRTLLPICYVSEPLGADVEWDAALDQVTVKLGSQTIVMWINNGTARINGVETPIDSSNPNVTPIIVPPGRTMMPLSFIAANLGCDVQWNAATSEVTVTYPKAS